MRLLLTIRVYSYSWCMTPHCTLLSVLQFRLTLLASQYLQIKTLPFFHNLLQTLILFTCNLDTPPTKHTTTSMNS
uniref:Uncharacterized protein n=1 Tax=Octopus bimaculoides TaxID=37653 RepID=A0A0L8GNH9_OCTBM